MLYPVGWTVWLSLNGPATPRSSGSDRLRRARPTMRGSPPTATSRPRSCRRSALSRRARARSHPRPRGGAGAASGLAGSKLFSAIVALAADGRAGRRRARLALHLCRRLRHDRLRSRPHSASSGPLWFADIWLARDDDRHRQFLDGAALRHPRAACRPGRLPTDPMEAARVDGATPWQMLWLVIAAAAEAGDRHDLRRPASPTHSGSSTSSTC